MNAFIEANRDRITALAAGRGIREVRVFGSMARGDATDDSDVDLLVVLPAGQSGLALGGFWLELEALLHRRVDLVTEAGLHPLLRERVLREAEPL